MSHALHDQLSRLAEEATPPQDATPGIELWARGTRYRRRMRNGSLLIVAVAVIVLTVLSSATVRSAGPTPEPAPANAPAGLPARIHVPSPWLPGTDEAGPPGQTVAMFPADRGGWTGTTRNLVAVSAATGDYRFLDLPDAVLIDDAALSPDGRRIAFWVTGPTSATANTAETGGEGAVAGVAVYDTRTEEIVRHDFATEHGLSPSSLAWVAPSALVIRHLQYLAGDDGPEMEQASANDESSWRWDVSLAEPQPWPLAQQIGGDDWGAPSNGRVAVGNLDDVFVVDGSSSRAVERGSRLNYSVGRYAVSPDGTRIAGIWGNNRMPNDVAILTVSPAGKRDLARLDEADLSFEVEGWRDEAHVVVTRRSEAVREGLGMSVYAVDSTSGSADELVILPEGWFNGVQWAPDLLSAPVVDRPAPPTPLDPRLVRGLAALTLLAAGFALWRWRRRVAP